MNAIKSHTEQSLRLFHSLKNKKHELEAKVADVFGYQKATLTPIVDKSILGGVIVEADHQVIDGSLASQLNGLRAALSKK